MLIQPSQPACFSSDDECDGGEKPGVILTLENRSEPRGKPA